MTTPSEPSEPSASAARAAILSVLVSWIATTIGVFLVMALLDSGERLLWFPIVLAAVTLLTFCLQLALDRKEGLVNRVMLSLSGSVVILALATGLNFVLAGA